MNDIDTLESNITEVDAESTPDTCAELLTRIGFMKKRIKKPSNCSTIG